MPIDVSSCLHAAPAGITVRVKVVSGASRTAIVGPLGDRLKIAVAAPPQAGKANRAVCKLLAHTFALAARDVQVTAGHTQSNKTLRISSISLPDATNRLKSSFRPTGKCR